MDVQGWTFLIVGLSFALYIGIAWWARAASTGEFYVAGKGVPPIANGMATAADWMSAASFLGMAGLISFMGYDGSVYLMGWTGGYVLLALLLAPYLRKFGRFTVPDFVGDRYESSVGRVVAVLCAIFVSFTYVAGQMKGVGLVFARFLEVDTTTGVIIGMGIVFLYAVLGGMKGITYTQVAQYCVLIFAYMVPAIFVSMLLTGLPIPQLGLGAHATDGQWLLAKLDGLNTDLGFSAYTDGSKQMIDVFCITGALMVGTAGLPHVIIRFYTVPRMKDARASVGWALLFIAILYTTAPAVAAFARTNMIETVNGKSLEEAPAWVEKWSEIDSALVGFEDKNGNGAIDFRAGDENELTVNADIMVLASPEIAGLPAWIVGLVAAGALAAALSTAAGLLLVVSSAVSHDLLKRTFMPSISEKAELRAARISAAVAVVIAGLLGLYDPSFVAQVVAIAFGLAASSFFPAILLGIFWKRANRYGAVTGMVAGIGFTAAYIIYFKFQHPELNNAEHWWLGISPEGIGLIGMLINFAIAISLSLCTPPPSKEVQALVDHIRSPG